MPRGATGGALATVALEIEAATRRSAVVLTELLCGE